MPSARRRFAPTAIGLLAAAFALCSHSASAAAQELQMQFTRLGGDESLSQGAVTSIAQDKQGFLWLGTEDGLIRYNGQETEHIYRDRRDVRGLPNNWISSMVLDGDGQLWIGTDGGGIVRYDALDRHFHAPVAASGAPLIDPQTKVRHLSVDRDGRLWVATRTSGVFLLDVAAGTARQFRHDPDDPGSLASDSAFRVVVGADGAVWVGTLAGLDRLEPTSGQIEHFGDRLQELFGTRQPPQVTALHVDERGMLWVGGQAGLARIEPLTGRITAIRPEPGDATAPRLGSITTILEDSESRLWAGTTAGLALVDRRSNHVRLARRSPIDRFSLPDDSIIALFQDRGGLLWVGTKFGGAASWNPRSWSFGYARLTQDEADNVTAFGQDRQGTLWVGTFGTGLFAIDRASGQVRSFRRSAGGTQGIGDDNIMALAIDGSDGVWLGTMGAGVERLDPRTGQVRRFTHDPKDPESLAAPGVMSMMVGSQGRIWVGTYGGGLNRIDPDTGRIHRYPIGSDGLSNDRATALMEDRTGLIWIGTDGGGLNVLDPLSGRFQHFAHDDSDPRSLSADIVYSVHEDSRGRIWVGTRGGGVNQAVGSPFGGESLYFRSYSESDGLPNSTVYGIESDPAGRLWLSTNRGLARFDPETGNIRSFHRSHGLQSDEFNFGAHFRSSDGELFFGGPRGFNAFFAERLRFNETPPPVVLTAMLKLNEPIDIGEALAGTSPVELRYDDDAVTFRFAALDYTDPEANQYAYKLDGFDRDWINANDSRQATYTNLAGGHYVFRVRASNSDGTWNDAGLAIPLQVENPPWLRWWAMAGYAGVLGLVMLAVWASQQRKVEREVAYARRLECEVQERTRELAERNDQLQDANHLLHEASVTDALTGVGNRRSLRDAVTRLLDEAESASSAGYDTSRFVLMIIDLDRLKPINDEHGHEAGDKVLIEVAGILTSLCRNSDHVCRWGGDEFVVLCRDADLAAASVLAERIRATVAKQIFRIGDGAAARSSCSIGFATFPFIVDARDKLGWEQVLALADAALYQSKRQRNMWVGWAGTARAQSLENLVQVLEDDPETLEEEGLVEVRRRIVQAEEDTVDRLLTLGGKSA